MSSPRKPERPASPETAESELLNNPLFKERRKSSGPEEHTDGGALESAERKAELDAAIQKRREEHRAQALRDIALLVALSQVALRDIPKLPDQKNKLFENIQKHLAKTREIQKEWIEDSEIADKTREAIKSIEAIREQALVHFPAQFRNHVKFEQLKEILDLLENEMAKIITEHEEKEREKAKDNVAELHEIFRGFAKELEGAKELKTQLEHLILLADRYKVIADKTWNVATRAGREAIFNDATKDLSRPKTVDAPPAPAAAAAARPAAQPKPAPTTASSTKTNRTQALLEALRATARAISTANSEEEVNKIFQQGKVSELRTQIEALQKKGTAHPQIVAAVAEAESAYDKRVREIQEALTAKTKSALEEKLAEAKALQEKYEAPASSNADKIEARSNLANLVSLAYGIQREAAISEAQRTSLQPTIEQIVAVQRAVEATYPTVEAAHRRELEEAKAAEKAREEIAQRKMAEAARKIAEQKAIDEPFERLLVNLQGWPERLQNDRARGRNDTVRYATQEADYAEYKLGETPNVSAQLREDLQTSIATIRRDYPDLEWEVKAERAAAERKDEKEEAPLDATPPIAASAAAASAAASSGAAAVTPLSAAPDPASATAPAPTESKYDTPRSTDDDIKNYLRELSTVYSEAGEKRFVTFWFNKWKSRPELESPTERAHEAQGFKDFVPVIALLRSQLSLDPNELLEQELNRIEADFATIDFNEESRKLVDFAARNVEAERKAERVAEEIDASLEDVTVEMPAPFVVPETPEAMTGGVDESEIEAEHEAREASAASPTAAAAAAAMPPPPPAREAEEAPVVHLAPSERLLSLKALRHKLESQLETRFMDEVGRFETKRGVKNKVIDDWMAIWKRMQETSQAGSPLTKQDEADFVRLAEREFLLCHGRGILGSDNQLRKLVTPEQKNDVRGILRNFATRITPAKEIVRESREYMNALPPIIEARPSSYQPARAPEVSSAAPSLREEKKEEKRQTDLLSDDELRKEIYKSLETNKHLIDNEPFWRSKASIVDDITNNWMKIWDAVKSDPSKNTAEAQDNLIRLAGDELRFCHNKANSTHGSPEQAHIRRILQSYQESEKTYDAVTQERDTWIAEQREKIRQKMEEAQERLNRFRRAPTAAAAPPTTAAATPVVAQVLYSGPLPLTDKELRRRIKANLENNKPLISNDPRWVTKSSIINGITEAWMKIWNEVKDQNSKGTREAQDQLIQLAGKELHYCHGSVSPGNDGKSTHVIHGSPEQNQIRDILRSYREEANTFDDVAGRAKAWAIAQISQEARVHVSASASAGGAPLAEAKYAAAAAAAPTDAAGFGATVAQPRGRGWSDQDAYTAQQQSAAASAFTSADQRLLATAQTLNLGDKARDAHRKEIKDIAEKIPYLQKRLKGFREAVKHNLELIQEAETSHIKIANIPLVKENMNKLAQPLMAAIQEVQRNQALLQAELALYQHHRSGDTHLNRPDGITEQMDTHLRKYFNNKHQVDVLEKALKQNTQLLDDLHVIHKDLYEIYRQLQEGGRLAQTDAQNKTVRHYATDAVIYDVKDDDRVTITAAPAAHHADVSKTIPIKVEEYFHGGHLTASSAGSSAAASATLSEELPSSALASRTGNISATKARFNTHEVLGQKFCWVEQQDSVGRITSEVHVDPSLRNIAAILANAVPPEMERYLPPQFASKAGFASTEKFFEAYVARVKHTGELINKESIAQFLKDQQKMGNCDKSLDVTKVMGTGLAKRLEDAYNAHFTQTHKGTVLPSAALLEVAMREVSGFVELVKAKETAIGAIAAKKPVTIHQTWCPEYAKAVMLYCTAHGYSYTQSENQRWKLSDPTKKEVAAYQALVKKDPEHLKGKPPAAIVPSKEAVTFFTQETEKAVTEFTRPRK